MQLTQLKGVGEKTRELFEKLGIHTVEDLLTYYPRDYDEYQPPITIGEIDNKIVAAIEGVIVKKLDIQRKGKLQVIKGLIRDNRGETLPVTWFNMPFLRQTLQPGFRYVFRGRLKRMGNEIQLQQPETFPLGKYEEKLLSMQPVYSLTKGVTNHLIQKCIRTALEQGIVLDEFLPVHIRQNYNLTGRMEAVEMLHFPKDRDGLHKARHRLVFDEFFLFLYTLQTMKESGVTAKSPYVIVPAKQTEEFQRKLPFELTRGQQKALSQIRSDLGSANVMNRLIQGDVGSGKTILSVLALMDVIFAGYQGALMAPTEVLARQHYISIKEMFDEYNVSIQIQLLTGSMTAKEKRMAYEEIEQGRAQLIVGTHALIQEKVIYQNLALVVTDEQHRFGVRQRENLAQKGNSPHIMVMSATPIPRSLAIVLYGDLDVSVIRELPANRLPIKNCVVDTSFRPNAYQFITKQAAQGHQAYIICPMVEENEELDIENVIDYAKMLEEQLPSTVRVQYLHGKMKNDLKNQIMEDFARGEIQVLVSTTVVEVGVNVPNATVMMVENAERFGLAGLHQLRGRVGRGSAQSYCIFVSGSKKKETMDRLEILNHSNDGFEIAREDLKLRGPGDFFGMRQSGDMDFRIGNIYTDADVLGEVSQVLKELKEDKWDIEEEQWQVLHTVLEQYQKNSLEKLNI